MFDYDIQCVDCLVQNVLLIINQSVDKPSQKFTFPQYVISARSLKAYVLYALIQQDWPGLCVFWLQLMIYGERWTINMLFNKKNPHNFTKKYTILSYCLTV